MATNIAKQRPKPTMEPPPRTLDVRKYAEARASELESLHSIVSGRLNDNFRSRHNKRRRTTGFDSKNHLRCRKSRKLLKSEGDRQNDTKKLPRRVRRRIEFKKNLQTGFSVSADGTRRLRTHLWHAKRFTMDKLWGFYLPLGLHGRGRGSRALLKWYHQGVVVHDASYYGAVQLEGKEDLLLSILSMLLVPSPSDHSEDAWKLIISGKIYGNAMLHHGEHDGCKAICPVTYMWRPSNHLEYKETDEDIQTEKGSCFRRLWIWLHPSSFNEGFDCLKLACQKKTDETGVLVDCLCLGGQLGRLEVMGSKAFQLLQKILQPCTLSGLKGFSESHSLIVEDENGRRSNTVLSSRVVDPRILPVKRPTAFQEGLVVSDIDGLSEDVKKDQSVRDPHMKEEELETLQRDLWDINEGVNPPMEEKDLCLERQRNSLEFFCLTDTTSANAKPLSPESQFSRSCPILLLSNTDHTGAFIGWSIILPLSWVKAFWIPLISGGAHAIGLREKHWISCDVGLPSFPSDFPDCNAYSRFMAKEAAEVDKNMECRTPDLRPLKVPIPSPWTSINFGFEDNSSKIQSHEDNSAEDFPLANNSGCGCELFVARTPTMLTSFLKKISGEDLLLFPKVADRKSFSHLLKDEEKLIQASKVSADLAYHGKSLCYLRVILHAYKEGVFDKGAVVCAPRFSDLSLWISRSDSNEVGLQVPHASLGSYLKQKSNGEWEFELPEDITAREAFRQPIGFVTTGFVRGSKRAWAVALCEAVGVAHLRQQQWSGMTVKKRRKEIFALVRNLRSTAYRLALATIVLEQHQDDVRSL